MIKCKIHIVNDSEIYDENVFVECTLPAVPRKGDTLWLSNGLTGELEQKALKSETLSNYFPNWFFGHTPKEFEDINDECYLSFDDAITVEYVRFDSFSDTVVLSLNSL